MVLGLRNMTLGGLAKFHAAAGLPAPLELSVAVLDLSDGFKTKYLNAHTEPE